MFFRVPVLCACTLIIMCRLCSSIFLLVPTNFWEGFSTWIVGCYMLLFRKNVVDVELWLIIWETEWHLSQHKKEHRFKWYSLG